MNGRLYDPAVGAFLSPDPYVQEPDLTLSYNRYSYCLNNPLKYTDPGGYTWGIFKPFVKAAKWVGNNIGTIATVAYLVAVAAVTVACPVAGMAMFGAYLGGMSANGGKMNMGRWDWKDPTTYVGIGIGGLMGALGGQMLFGANGVFAGGTTLNLSLSATFQNVGAAFANINIGAAGISLADIGYATIAGGGAVLTGMAVKSLFNKHGIEGAYPTNKSPHNKGPFFEERGNAWNPKIEGPNNNSFLPKGNPKAPDWMEWIIYPVGGWAAGHELYKQWKGPDIPDVSAPTTTDKTPQVGPKKE